MSATLVVLFTTALVAPSGTDLALSQLPQCKGAVNKEQVPLTCLRSMSPMRIYCKPIHPSRRGRYGAGLKMRLTSIGNDLLTAVADLVRAEASRLSVPFVVGVTEDAEFVYDVETGNFVNAQYVVMPDGDVVDRYVKVIKVPFGEYIPFRSARTLGAPTGLIPKMRSLEPGLLSSTSMALAHLGRDLVGGVFGSRSRDAVTRGARSLSIRQTGRVTRGQLSKASRLLRASFERSRPVDGNSGCTHRLLRHRRSSGNVLERSDISEQIVLYSTPMRRSGTTVYTHIGDAPFAIAALLLVIIPMMLTRRSRSQDHRSQSTPSSPS